MATHMVGYFTIKIMSLIVKPPFKKKYKWVTDWKGFRLIFLKKTNQNNVISIKKIKKQVNWLMTKSGSGILIHLVNLSFC